MEARTARQRTTIRRPAVAVAMAMAIATLGAAPASADALTYNGPVCVQVNDDPSACTSRNRVSVGTGWNSCAPYDAACVTGALVNGTSISIEKPAATTTS